MCLALDRSKELAVFCRALDYIPTVYPELTKRVNDMLKKAATMLMEKIVDVILKEYDHLKLRGTNGTIHTARDTEVLLRVNSGADTTIIPRQRRSLTHSRQNSSAGHRL